MAATAPAQPAGASAASADGLAQLSNIMAGAEGAAPAGPTTDQEMAEAKAMPVRQYLETRVVPLLLQGMQRLVIERPVDPVEFLAKYLVDNNPRKKVEEKPPVDPAAAPADPAAAGAAPPAPPAAPAK